MMKRIVLALCGVLMLSGCGSGVSQEDYDGAVAEMESYSSRTEELQSELSSVEEEAESLQEQLSLLESEYAEYKEKMSEYEELSEAEAEARLIEAERIAAEEQARQEQEEAEARAEAEAKEKLGYETGITYEQLARTPDDYIGEKVKFTGEVIQVIEGDDYIQIRLAVDDYHDDIILGEYDRDIVDSRILVDDVITIYGVSAGVITYESVMGGMITIPGIAIDKIDQ